MTGILQVIAAGGGGVLVSAITGWFVRASGTSSSSRGCYLQFGSDGSIVYGITAGVDKTTLGTDRWYGQITTGIGANYWIRANLVSGPSMTVGTLNTWLSLTNAQNFGHVPGTTDQTANPLVLNFDFSNSASGSPILLTSGNLSIARTSP